MRDVRGDSPPGGPAAGGQPQGLALAGLLRALLQHGARSAQLPRPPRRGQVLRGGAGPRRHERRLHPPGPSPDGPSDPPATQEATGHVGSLRR